MKKLLIAAAVMLAFAIAPAEGQGQDQRIMFRAKPKVLEILPAKDPGNPGDPGSGGQVPGDEPGGEDPVPPAGIVSVSLPAFNMPVGFANEAWEFDFRDIVEVEGGTAADLEWSFGQPSLPWAGFVVPGHVSGIPSQPGLYDFRMNTKGGTHESSRVYKVFVDGHELVATDIAAGPSHTCAATPDGRALCWGKNNYGQLGNGTTSQSSTPVQVQGIGGRVVSVAVGGSSSCAATADGSAFCWGQGTSGQLGNSAATNRNTAVPVSNLSGIMNVTVGSTHACAMTAGGVYCWGNATYGRVGNGQTSGIFSTPQQVSGLVAGTVKSIAGNAHVTCVVMNDDTAKCWGMGASGRLGRGSTADSAVPVHVVNAALPGGQPITSVKEVKPGFAHGCLLRHGGDVWCWGNGGNFLGKADNAASNYAMLASKLPTDISQLAVGGYHGCYIRAGGTTECFGWNDKGQHGSGSADSVQLHVNPLQSVSMMSMGEYHSCAIGSAGRVFCWGAGIDGQIGDGGTATRTSPVQVKAAVKP